MDQMKKPEWFELVEKDGGKPHSSVKRSTRGALLALPLLLIGIGVVVAQGSDEPTASAETTTVASGVTQTATASPSAASVKPAIATPPTGGGDYDDEDAGYEDEGDDD